MIQLMRMDLKCEEQYHGNMNDAKEEDMDLATKAIINEDDVGKNSDICVKERSFFF